MIPGVRGPLPEVREEPPNDRQRVTASRPLVPNARHVRPAPRHLPPALREIRPKLRERLASFGNRPPRRAGCGVAAARELRDRFLEHVNGEASALPSEPKYNVSRRIEGREADPERRLLEGRRLAGAAADSNNPSEQAQVRRWAIHAEEVFRKPALVVSDSDYEVASRGFSKFGEEHGDSFHVVEPALGLLRRVW